MKAHVLKGSKQEIVNGVARLNGEVREAIVFVEDFGDTGVASTAPQVSNLTDIFAEMEQFTVRVGGASFSRREIYDRAEGE
jgi:hypothetical protein